MQRILKGAGKPDDLARSQKALDMGLALDSQNVEARVFKTYVRLFRGEKHLARMLTAKLRAQAPNNPSVHYVSAVLYRLDGEYESCLRSIDRASRLNPAERLSACWNRARVFMFQGRYDEAMKHLDLGATIEPNHPLLKAFRAQVLHARGSPEAAAELLKETLLDHPEIEGLRPLLAMSLSALGEHQAARAQLTDRVKQVAGAEHDVPYWLASAYAMEGERDEAFTWLKTAIRLGNENLPWFRSNPAWKPLHDDPRFKEIMSQLEVAREQRKLTGDQ